MGVNVETPNECIGSECQKHALTGKKPLVSHKAGHGTKSKLEAKSQCLSELHIYEHIYDADRSSSPDKKLVNVEASGEKLYGVVSSAYVEQGPDSR